MKREWKRTKIRVTALALTVTLTFVTAAGLTGCSKEQTEEQSRALIALENVVSWYEEHGAAEHWEDLVALCFANYADGVAVNWSQISLPEAEVNPDRQSSFAGAIITDVIKGEGNSSLYTNQLLLMQDPETGGFADGADINMHVYSMLALNISLGSESYDYEDAAAYLLNYQTLDGGFAAEGDGLEKGNVLLTGLASIALAPYFEANSRSVELDRLSNFYVISQDQSGGYLNPSGEPTSHATSAAIWGLTALNLSLPTAEESGKTPLDFLLELQNEDGTFRLQPEDEPAANSIATRRAAIALCDIVNGMNTFRLLATDSEAYRVENPAGPNILLSIEYPEDSQLEDFHDDFVIEPGSSVFDATIFYGLSTKVPVSFSGSVSNRTIEGIGGVTGEAYDEHSRWVYYVNGQISPFPPSAVRLEEGDHLKWVYVMGEEAASIAESLEQESEMQESGEDR